MKLKIHLIAYWNKFVDAISVFWRFASRKAKQLIRPVQMLLGFKVLNDNSKSKSVDISTYLTETDDKLAELPEDFRELFGVNEEIDRDIYVNTSNNLMNFDAAYKRWDNGFAASIVVVGERGSGKSTLLKMALEETKPEHVVHVEVDDTSWKLDQMLKVVGTALGLEDYSKTEAIIRGINNNEKRQVAVIENLQNLYLRTINGFDALEALWLIISETKDKVMWVCTCSRYTWLYLTKVQGIDTHFTHILETDKLDESQMQSIITKRCEAEGYRIIIDPDDSTKRSRSYKKRLNDDETLEEYLKSDFFETLNDTSEGNASVGLLIWLRSVQKVEGKEIHLKKIQPVSIEGLDILTPEVLFVLAVIVVHDSLKVTEVTRILNMSVVNSRVIMTKLRSRGLLTERKGWFQLNQLIYRQTIRLLKSRNIIH